MAMCPIALPLHRIGYSTGHVDMFNMQSGLHRGTYGTRAHKGGVRGVAVEGLNQLVITAGADSIVRFWKFKTKELLDSVTVESQIASIKLHRESGMLALSLDNFDIVIIDIETRKIVRIFSGHSNRITDVTFRSDGRWLVSSSMDSTVRTWDLPTGKLVDCFLIDSAVTSVAFSPTSDFLLTTHVDDLGLYLWSNMTLYTHVSLRPLPEDYVPLMIDMPSTSRVTKGERPDDDAADEDAFLTSEFKSPEHISHELVTLSSLPNSRWQNLLSLDVIKERNKPKEPPKAPIKAPFFLPTVAGLQPKFVVPDIKPEEKEDTKWSAFDLPLSVFGEKLASCSQSKNYAGPFYLLKEMGPSGIDAEVRTLAPSGGGSFELCGEFVEMIDFVLQSNQDFELAQSYLGLFLKHHGLDICESKEIVHKLERVQESQGHAWEQLQMKFNQSLCLVNYMRSAALS